MKKHFKGLGFKPDLPDIRDFTFESNIIRKKRDFPRSVDLRGHPDMPPIWDQKELGACTAFSVGALCAFEYGADFCYDPSKLFLYYVTRSLEGTVDVDSGASIRNTIKAVNVFGNCVEKHWPYDIKKFKDAPPKEIFDMAEYHQALKYSRVKQRLDDIREALVSDNPISFGIAVYPGLYKITKGNPILEMPDYSQEMLGGHALVLVSYNDDKQLFGVRNSWGAWGEDNSGYFYIPYNYVLNSQLSMDFWIIENMER
jgi:C1A family cysteine protease